jgi:hypothetical protein
MNNYETNIKIAELLGAKWYRSGSGRVSLLFENPTNPLFEGPLEFVPSFIREATNLASILNYSGSLEACAQFEATLTDEERREYHRLCLDFGKVPSDILFITAPQRCEAFLKAKSAK